MFLWNISSEREARLRENQGEMAAHPEMPFLLFQRAISDHERDVVGDPEARLRMAEAIIISLGIDLEGPMAQVLYHKARHGTRPVPVPRATLDKFQATENFVLRDNFDQIRASEPPREEGPVSIAGAMQGLIMESGLEVPAFAGTIGLDPTSVRRMAAGRTGLIKEETVFKIAKALNLPPDNDFILGLLFSAN